MEVKKTGIYITTNSATAASLAGSGKDAKAAASLTIKVAGELNFTDNPETVRQFAEQIFQQSAAQSIVFKDAGTSLAIDSALFLQHTVHSDFSDARQIAQTIRFDTEEALASDVSDIAISFQIASTGETGSNLSVFTSQRKLLKNIIDALSKYNIDPVFIEPDIICLARYLHHKFEQHQTEKVLYAVLSPTNGYIIVPPSVNKKQSMLRTFIVGSAQDKIKLLTSQVAMSTALFASTDKITSLAVFDSAGPLDADKLSQTLGIKVQNIDLAEGLPASVQQPAVDTVSAAIAAGAALAFEDKQRADFRADFSPYQGKQVKLEKNLRIIAICAAVCLIAIGIFAQTALYNVNKPRKIRREIFNMDFAAVMPGVDAPSSLVVALKELENERRRLANISTGFIGGQQTISDKLALVIKSFNASAEFAKLEIQTVDVTQTSIRITGSTANEAGSKRLRDAITQNNLKIDSETWTTKGDRQNFVMNLSLNIAGKGGK